MLHVCIAQQEKKSSSKKRSGKVQQDSYRQLLTLDPGCRMLKTAKFCSQDVIQLEAFTALALRTVKTSFDINAKHNQLRPQLLK